MDYQYINYDDNYKALLDLENDRKELENKQQKILCEWGARVKEYMQYKQYSTTTAAHIMGVNAASLGRAINHNEWSKRLIEASHHMIHHQL